MRKGVLERARVFITALALAVSASFLCFAPSNKSLDVRAKHGRCFVCQLLSVLPHVISSVRRFHSALTLTEKVGYVVFVWKKRTSKSLTSLFKLCGEKEISMRLKIFGILII